MPARPKEWLQPPPLRPGGRIGVAAPAGPVRRPDLDRGLAYLERRGFALVEGQSLRARHGYLAGPDPDRLADLDRLLADPSLDAIWFARGGYGCGRIVSDIDLTPLRAHPKALIGYSDLTVIHSAAHRQLQLATYYGPMVADLSDPARFDEASLWSALETGVPADHSFGASTVLRPGAGEGRIVGGCLSLLVGLIGTPFDLPMEGTILFWEEINEEPFRIDRMLGHLRLANKLAGLRGMIVGRLIGCDAREKENGLPIEEILTAHLRGTDYPVILDFPAGHAPKKVTLPFGRRARLDTGSGVLSFSEP